MDYQFIAKMLLKHQEHLVATERNLNHLIGDYDRQIESLEKIVSSSPQYRNEIRKLEAKKNEALIKLGFVVPNKDKITEQVALLETNA
jgi:prefoldin subunit 5